jgi:hypothetical protein
MIVDSPFTVNIAKIGRPNSLYDQLVDGLESSPYNQSDGFGFTVEAIEQDYVSAYLVLSNPVAVRQFEQESGEIVEREVNQEKLIPFRVDFDTGLLEIFSSQSDTSQVITRVSEIIEWSSPITETGIKASSLYSSLRESAVDIEIQSMHISDFEYDDVRGNYHLKSFEESEAENLLSEYAGDISFLCISAENHNETATFGFYRSGSIRLYNNTNHDDQFWNDMKYAVSENLGDV